MSFSVGIDTASEKTSENLDSKDSRTHEQGENRVSKKTPQDHEEEKGPHELGLSTACPLFPRAKKTFFLFFSSPSCSVPPR